MYFYSADCYKTVKVGERNYLFHTVDRYESMDVCRNTLLGTYESNSMNFGNFYAAIIVIFMIFLVCSLLINLYDKSK